MLDRSESVSRLSLSLYIYTNVSVLVLGTSGLRNFVACPLLLPGHRNASRPPQRFPDAATATS